MTVFIRDGQAILYVHVPKTGGTSVEAAFSEAGWGLEYKDGQGEINFYRRVTPQHMHARLLNATFRVGRFRGVFMTVRDPVSRFQSEYLHRHRRRKSLPLDAVSVEAWAFAQFEKLSKNPYLFDNHLRPQSDFFLPRARVYRVEDGLDAMLRDVNRVFDIDGPLAVARVNDSEAVSGVSSQDVAISPRLFDEIRSRYASDYETFGYEP